jgi:hypothetical protein
MTSINSNTGFVYIKQISNLQYYSYDNSTWITISWPATINSSCTVLFTTNITLTITDSFFICSSDNIQFGNTQLNSDGTRPIITISGITGYRGFIYNLDKNNIIICNLIIDGTTSTLSNNYGWLTQANFSTGSVVNYIINCTSNGTISNSSGGIVGSFSGYNGGTIYVIGCTSSGDMDFNAGGIIAASCAGNSNSKIYVTQCSSSGIIGPNAGGICGNSCGINGGNITITKSYSTGIIAGSGGGICGITCGYNGIAIAENCYSSGMMYDSAGGIFGGNAGLNGGQATANNCYSSGDGSRGRINCGGIFGINYGNAIASHCYTSGFATTGGIFYLLTNDNPPGSSNNFSEGNNGNTGQWSDNNAQNHLLNVGSTSWISQSSNIPYLISNLGSTPYSLNTFNNLTYTLNNTYTYPSTIISGQSTLPAIVSGYTTFNLLGTVDPTISINTSDGTIITSSNTPSGTYHLIIYADGIYTITNYTLTVLGSNNNIGYSSSTLPPCCQVNDPNPNPLSTDYDSNIIINKHSSKAIDQSVDTIYRGISTGQRTAYSQPIFKSYHDYILFLQGKLR